MKLKSIIETIILCAKQNIPLSGQHDSGCDVEQHPSEGHGNFCSLLQFCISAGDTALSEHLASSPRNATYTSPQIQNEVIDILGDYVP